MRRALRAPAAAIDEELAVPLWSATPEGRPILGDRLKETTVA